MKKQEMKKFELFTQHLMTGKNIYSVLLKQASRDLDYVKWEVYKNLKREYKELLDFARSLRVN